VKNGKNGKNGKDGKNGKVGIDGKDGKVGIDGLNAVVRQNYATTAGEAFFIFPNSKAVGDIGFHGRVYVVDPGPNDVFIFATATDDQTIKQLTVTFNAPAMIDLSKSATLDVSFLTSPPATGIPLVWTPTATKVSFPSSALISPTPISTVATSLVPLVLPANTNFRLYIEFSNTSGIDFIYPSFSIGAQIIWE